MEIYLAFSKVIARSKKIGDTVYHGVAKSLPFMLFELRTIGCTGVNLSSYSIDRNNR